MALVPTLRILPKLPVSKMNSFLSFINGSHTAKAPLSNFNITNKWKHLTVALTECSKQAKSYHSFAPVLQITQDVTVRAYSHHSCLNQREGQTPEIDADHIEKELAAENKLSRKRKQAASDPKNSMINVGRMVPHKVLELWDEDGTSFGTVNKNQAIALSQEKKLKLVLLKPGAKPWPIYKLMTGQELHEEQVKRNEKAKKKTTPTQLKEIKASWNMGQHDIGVRRRQLENWFSEEHSNIHARVTVTGGRGTEVIPQDKQMEVVKQLMAGLEDRLTLNGPPQMVGKNLGTLRVTIRTMSSKEKAAHKKSIAENGQTKPS